MNRTGVDKRINFTFQTEGFRFNQSKYGCELQFWDPLVDICGALLKIIATSQHWYNRFERRFTCCLVAPAQASWLTHICRLLEEGNG